MFTPGSRACAYKTASGRGNWPNRDPLEEQGGVNTYALSDNDAVNFCDSLGRLKVTWAKEIIDPNLNVDGEDDDGQEWVTGQIPSYKEVRCMIGIGRKYDLIEGNITINIAYRSLKIKKSKGPSGLTTEQHEKAHANVDIAEYQSIEKWYKYLGSFCFCSIGTCQETRLDLMDKVEALFKAKSEMENAKIDVADLKGDSRYAKKVNEYNSDVAYYNSLVSDFNQLKTQFDSKGCGK